MGGIVVAKANRMQRPQPQDRDGDVRSDEHLRTDRQERADQADDRSAGTMGNTRDKARQARDKARGKMR